MNQGSPYIVPNFLLATPTMTSLKHIGVSLDQESLTIISWREITEEKSLRNLQARSLYAVFSNWWSQVWARIT